jgi:hypothetical protein
MALAAPTPPPARAVQLVLPLLACPAVVSDGGTAGRVSPQQVWVSLPPLQREQLRHAFVSLLEEVCHDRA